MAADLTTQNLTDVGNAERLVAMHGEGLRYVAKWGWVAWYGTRWRRDHKGLVRQAAKSTISALKNQASARWAAEYELAKNDPRRDHPDRVMGFAIGSESLGKQRAMVELAQSDQTIALEPSDFDAHPYLFNCAKTTVDLRTGIERKPNRADLLTIGADIEPKPAPMHETAWEIFLSEIMPDEDTRKYLQRAIGCSLIGEQRDHVIFLAYGGGRNGKGTLFRAIANAVGDYYTPIPSDMLMERPYQPHASQMADLLGKRIVVASEVPKGKRLDEGKVKELSGGDRIKAQFMREDWFSYKPTHTLWICANNRPRIAGTDKGIWRRMRVIPFSANIADDKEDLDLDAKLAADAGYVLQWCLDGAKAYMEQGLGTCKAVVDATTEYRVGEDLLGAAIEELCTEGEDLLCSKADFRAAIAAWYDEQGLPFVPNDRVLKADFEHRNISDKRPTGLGWHWSGIALKPEYAAAAAKAQAAPQPKSYRSSWND